MFSLNKCSLKIFSRETKKVTVLFKGQKKKENNVNTSLGGSNVQFH